MPTLAVSDASFEQDVLQSSKPVLVDFWAEWCAPCKQIGPALEELAGERADVMTIAKVNIDDNPDVPSKFGPAWERWRRAGSPNGWTKSPPPERLTGRS